MCKPKQNSLTCSKNSLKMEISDYLMRVIWGSETVVTANKMPNIAIMANRCSNWGFAWNEDSTTGGMHSSTIWIQFSLWYLLFYSDREIRVGFQALITKNVKNLYDRIFTMTVMKKQYLKINSLSQNNVK